MDSKTKWKIPINFVTLHYAYILTLGLLGLIILYPYGNIPAVDAYFFGVSASTESGLNTIDVNNLKTYQQLYIYFIPIIANLGFINIIVVVVRLHWFEKRLKRVAPSLLRARPPRSHLPSGSEDPEVPAPLPRCNSTPAIAGASSRDASTTRVVSNSDASTTPVDKQEGGLTDGEQVTPERNGDKVVTEEKNEPKPPNQTEGLRVTFEPAANRIQRESKTLYVPPPRDRERGYPLVEIDGEILGDEDHDVIKPVTSNAGSSTVRRRRFDGPSITKATSMEGIAGVASSMFILGTTPSRTRKSRDSPEQTPQSDMPYLSSQATLGRNSQFHNLTSRDREELGGIEYRSLKLLLKIVVVYFLSIHLFGAVCLVGWIHHADKKYLDWLQKCGQDKTWWAFYSAQTMVDNLGFTITPDSMITFQDAIFPMLIMSFLAFAGNTCYPVFLRFVIWTLSKLMPQTSSLKDPLNFLLKHPRRCYTLLFPSRPTWILFGILFVLNFVDVLLIILLDLNNPAVNNLALGPRVVAAIFQAASSRHTGTATFNLAAVNPAVQFSLLVMMYISVYPIAISIRASNTYEERSLGIYLPEAEMDENKGTSYVLTHLQNQLSFDLWYIFLGIFCICITESDKIMDPNNPAFAVFPIFFEVVSAYGNVGLSLGHPSVFTSLCGKFRPFSKIVICAMMIRGRHRGLPYQLDRAILLPNERLTDSDQSGVLRNSDRGAEMNAGRDEPLGSPTKRWKTF